MSKYNTTLVLCYHKSTFRMNNAGVRVTFDLLFDSFCEYDHDRWGQLVSQARMEVLAAPEMDVNADKGFNFSPSDNNFIVQKKNHFQVY